MQTSRTVLAVVVAITALAAACSRDAGTRRAPLPPDEATELLHQRIWLDQEPRKESDSFHVLVFDGEQSGVLQNRTIWKGSFEIFLYEAQRGRIDLRLPASRKRLHTGFTIEPAKRGQADVKLTLQKSPSGPTVYYGYRFDGGDADAWLPKTFGTASPD
jgi:hypothetical protein